MYTPVLIYITVLAHACAWEEMINYNRIDSCDTGTIGHSYKNINVKMISIFFHVHSCANLYTVLAHACAWEELINYNIDSYNTGAIGHSYKNINVEMISITMIDSCANNW